MSPVNHTNGIKLAKKKKKGRRRRRGGEGEGAQHKWDKTGEEQSKKIQKKSPATTQREWGKRRINQIKVWQKRNTNTFLTTL